MSQRSLMSQMFGMSCGVCALAGILLLGGCNSEPTGDAAYGQKFEVPPEVAEAAKKPAPPPLTRAEERAEDQARAKARQQKSTKRR